MANNRYIFNPVEMSPQLGAVTGQAMPPINLESQIETMATFLPEMNAAQEAFDMQRKLFEMSQKKYKQDRIDANISLGITGAKTAYELGTNPTVQKYGSTVWNAIQPKAPQMPVTNMAPVNYMQPGAGTSGGSVQPGTFQTQSMNSIAPSYTPEPPVPLFAPTDELVGTGMDEGGTSLAKSAMSSTAQPSTMSRIGGFKGIDVPGGNLSKAGLGAAADWAIKKSNFGETMGKGWGGEKEWDLAGSTLASFALGGPIGAGLNLATAGVQSYFKKNPKLSCIIVTACTSPTSPEVEIARAYRDKYMDTQTRRGYYLLADQIVPILQSNEELRKLCLEHLVLPMIRFGRWKLNQTSEHPSPIDCSITKNFLALCHDIGGTVKRYTRANSEEEV